MSRRNQVLLLMLISVALFFTRLGSISVYQVAEARNAECAREMLAGDSPIVPVFNGRLRTDKPALEYFAMMAAYRVGGVSEGSARFFSAVCGVLLVLFTFLLAGKYLGQKAAWWASLALLASPHLVAQFRLATPDPYLVLLDTLALYCFIEGWLSRSSRPGSGWRWYAGMYILLGLAVLAKGPVGLLLPALTILLFLISKRRFTWQVVLQLKPWWGLLLVLLFSAPWYVLVHYKTHGAWTKGFFLVHNIDRFSGAMGGHGGTFLLTWLFVFAGMLPFSVFIIHTLGYVWKRRGQNDLLLFSLLAFACVAVFYMLARTKLINYTVPCYPFLALMTGAFLGRLSETKAVPKGFVVPFIFLLIVCTALPLGYYFWTRATPGLHRFAWLAVFFLLYPSGALAALFFLRAGRIRAGLWSIGAVFMLGTAMLFAYPYPALDTRTSVRKAGALLTPGRRVAAYKKFNDAFVFYARRPIPVFRDTAALRRFMQRYPRALVVSRAGDQEPLMKMNGLKLIRKDHEIFGSRVSYIYEQERAGSAAR